MMSESETGLLTIEIRGTMTDKENLQGELLNKHVLILRDPSPELTEQERDQRTVFVQQLAARLRTKELIKFFEKCGPVREAQIVKDRLSGRSKG